MQNVIFAICFYTYINQLLLSIFRALIISTQYFFIECVDRECPKKRVAVDVFSSIKLDVRMSSRRLINDRRVEVRDSFLRWLMFFFQSW